MARKLADGLYDSVLNDTLAASLKELPVGWSGLREALDQGDSHERLARYFGRELSRTLAGFRGKEGEGVRQQVEIVNALLQALREKADASEVLDGSGVQEPAELLLAVHRPPGPPPRPATPLGTSALLTHARREPRIGAELSAEAESADEICMLVSFIKFAGWRRLQDSFLPFARAGKRLRVLTTTYMGATEKEALDAIARLPGAEVRISYDTRRTRLHAKAWLFQRQTGFSSVYVGSANVSSPALSDGLEWMMKASEAELPHVLEKFRGAFESLWQDGEFERYLPDDPASGERLAAALGAARGGPGQNSALFFDLRPFDFQQAILDKLRVEREEHGRWRNLVVAATGTGKTMIAAFDYRAQVIGPLKPRLLFVAHRKELLVQALQTYRQVLRDHDFGALLADGATPGSYEHLFASIQSLSSRNLVAKLGPDYWHTVVVDEFHHAAAGSYDRMLEAIRPQILLGLTATPERADGLDVLRWFDHHLAAEIRLWDALEKQLLTPFEYYGVHDGVSLEAVRWSRGAYDVGDLERVYTGNDARAALVLAKLGAIHGHPERARGLGFCVGVEHARYMARKFSEAGLPSLALDGRSEMEERAQARKRLEAGEVKFVFTCDLYNEGVDLPFVDTLLLLRPTESATLFLQQLGRGLRLHDGKQTTLVLDFIGQARAEYRFDRKLTALTGVPRGRLRAAVEEGFPTLPSGCHLQLEPVARDIVVGNLKQAIQGGANRLSAELRQLHRDEPAPLTLGRFLELSGRELSDVYSAGGWTILRRAAGLVAGEPAPREDRLSHALGNLIHVDDPERLRLYRRLAAEETPDFARLSPPDLRRLLMLGFRLTRDQAESIAALVEPLWASAPLRGELSELCEVLADRVAVTSPPCPLPPDWPLALHRTYARDEILAAVGERTPLNRAPHQSGVQRMMDRKIELLFVTLDKSSKHFSPNTAYEDYAIGPKRFHWQSQNTASEESLAGQRYLHGAGQGWKFYLFARPTVQDQFAFLGPVSYCSHRGGKPMNIVWDLEVALPAAFRPRYETLLAG